MNASSLPRTMVASACGAALIGAVLGANCGSKTPTRDGSTSTTSTPTTTTTVPPTTTTTSTATTSSTTTTSIPGLDARIDIQNAPCVAPGSGPVSCTFTGSATTGGRTPYTFNWRFTNFANNQVVTVNGRDCPAGAWLRFPGRCRDVQHTGRTDRQRFQ